MLWLPFLEMGTIWFWMILFVSAVVVSSFVDDDKYFGATVTAIGTFGFLALVGNFNPFLLVREHPGAAMMVIPVYIVAGVLWGLIKWAFFLSAARRKIDRVNEELTVFLATAKAENDRLKIQCLEMTKSPEAENDRSRIMRETAQDKWQSVERDLNSVAWRKSLWEEKIMRAGVRGPIPFKAREHKARIVAWMLYWPASAAWTLVNDPVRHLINAIYDRIGGLLQQMSNRTFEGADKAYSLPEGVRE